MPRHHLQPEALSTRLVQGHVLYSHVVVEGRCTIFIAGQLARDRQGYVVGKGDMRAQIRQVGENLKAALTAAGATLNDLVKTTTWGSHSKRTGNVDPWINRQRRGEKRADTVGEPTCAVTTNNTLRVTRIGFGGYPIGQPPHLTLKG
jgi:enamine deaminase RidA (YjgF/YER057c/UK114 family)